MKEQTAPIRIVHVVRSLGYGGVESGVLNVARRLSPSEFAQEIICVEGRGARAAMVPSSIPVHALGDDHGAGWRVIPRLAALLRRQKPDIVHARNCGSWIDGTLAWWLAGKPGRMMFSLHGLDWQSTLSGKRAWSYRRLAAQTSSLVAVSQDTATRFALQSGIDVGRFEILESGVEIPEPEAAPARISDEALRTGLVLGCVARLTWRKGFEELLVAFAELTARSSNSVRLVIVGEGPDEAAIRQRIEELGLSFSVRLTGGSDRVAARLRDFDVFVLASRQEGRSTAIMEAMSAGLPVIATDVGAARDLIEDGESGILVPAGDPVALTDALMRLSNSPDERRKLGTKARAIATRRFGVADMAERYATHYRGIAFPSPAPDTAARGGRSGVDAVVARRYGHH